MVWREEIKKALASAQVALLMVSADFLASDFVTREELPELFHAAKKEGCGSSGCRCVLASGKKSPKSSSIRQSSLPK
jgi:hypothetical protein